MAGRQYRREWIGPERSTGASRPRLRRRGQPPAPVPAGPCRVLPGPAGPPARADKWACETIFPAKSLQTPSPVEEAYRGSLKAMLLRYVGNYVVATFLVGTQNTVAWEGILYDVGNDYVTIYQEGRDRYIVSDVYSLKFIEFYDTRCREMCHEMLQNGQWQGGPT